MKTPLETAVPTMGCDPRCHSDYQPRFYPKANDRDAPPPDSAEKNDRIILQFLAAYYELNREYAKLLEIRNQPDSPQFREAERRRLESFETRLIVRDSLEDHYAPFGVVTEPVVEEGFVTNVCFSFGNRDARGRPRSDHYALSVYLPIPLPSGTEIKDLPCRIEGPGIEPD